MLSIIQCDQMRRFRANWALFLLQTPGHSASIHCLLKTMITKIINIPPLISVRPYTKLQSRFIPKIWYEQILSAAIFFCKKVYCPGSKMLRAELTHASP